MESEKSTFAREIGRFGDSGRFREILEDSGRFWKIGRFWEIWEDLEILGDSVRVGDSGRL